MCSGVSEYLTRAEMTDGTVLGLEKFLGVVSNALLENRTDNAVIT